MNAKVSEAEQLFDEIMVELRKAVDKFPTWPIDPIHAVEVINEKVGELNKAVLQEVYEPHKNKNGDVRKEAVQAAAMCLRFLAGMSKYKFTPGRQYEQSLLD